uniref:hypothetical protein n=1 Tax=Massilia sp. YIM B04103 TaxID=2963106 RepID=UPI00210D41E0
IPAGGEYFALLDNVRITRPLQEADLSAWANGLSADLKQQAARTDFGYDQRGLLANSTSYAKLDATGNGITDGSQSALRYVYDQTGQLLQSFDAKGAIQTWSVYDGAGRLTVRRDLNPVAIATIYNDVPTLREVGGVMRLTTQSTTTYPAVLYGTQHQVISTYDTSGKLLSTL